MGVLTAAVLATTALTLWAVAGRSPAGAVDAAITSAVNDRTAAVNLNGSVGVSGISIAVSGSGSMDFTRNSMEMRLSLPLGGHDFNETVVALGGVVYINEGDLIGQVLPGKSWISVDTAQLEGGGASAPGSAGVATGTVPSDPSALLKVLAQEGNTVTDLGPSTINGAAVEGYSVNVDAAAIRARVAREDRGDIPAWMRQALATVSDPNVNYRVYIDAAGGLDQLTSDVSLKEDGQAVTSHENMDFSAYGVPVSITAPPAGQVASIGDFLRAAQSGASTSTT
jgi:hypothetical protein